MLIGFVSKHETIAALGQVEQQGLARQSLSAMWMANSPHIHHGHQTDLWALEYHGSYFYISIYIILSTAIGLCSRGITPRHCWLRAVQIS